MHSGSWFLRRSALVPFPVWFEGEIPVGDTFIQILLSKRGARIIAPMRCQPIGDSRPALTRKVIMY